MTCSIVIHAKKSYQVFYMEQNKVVNLSSNDQNKIENLSNIEAEIALIGCLLWDNRNYEKISDFLDEDHFVD